MSAAFPALPAAGQLLVDDPAWSYRSDVLAGGGLAHLRIWTAAGGGHLAIVTELGLGASITNSVEHIWAALAERFGRPLWLLEHYPHAESAPLDSEHLDQVVVTAGIPRWRPIWPTPPGNPDHHAHERWMREHGAALLAAKINGTPVSRRQRPARGDLRRGGRHGAHVLPSYADDLAVQSLVEVVFDPQPLFPGLPRKPPEDPALVHQLLDHAPRPGAIGVDDWNRPLRADEVAEIWGAPMEGPDTRRAWLRRADEIARAWGKPLFGPGGLLPDTTLDEAAR